jgi:hypothetical protein
LSHESCLSEICCFHHALPECRRRARLEKCQTTGSVAGPPV